MIRAAAKNHRGRRGGGQAGELRRGAGRAGGVAAGRSRRRRGTGWRTRRSRRPPATTPRSAAGSRRDYEDFPEHLAVAYEKVLDLSYGENPHQRAALYTEVGAAQPRALAGSRSCTGGRSRSTTCSTSTRRGGLLGDFERAGLRDRQAQQPLRGGDRRRRRSRRTTKALACDPMSAFGGVIALNRPIDRGAGRASCTRTSSRC